MASVTNEAEPENIRCEVMQVANSAQHNNSSGNIYISSLNPHKSVDINNKEVLKRRIIQSQTPDGKAKKRKAFVKKFRKEWMDEPIFRGWLQPIPNLSEKCWCSVCNVVLLCGHSELEKHASGKKHSDLILLHQLKGNLMESRPPKAILDVINMEDSKKEENGMNSSDLTVVPTLQLPSEGSVDSHLVFHVMQDGTLVEMKVEDYEKVEEDSHDIETTPLKKVTPLSKGTVINVGNTTITKGNAAGKTMPAILRQAAKPSQVIKMTSETHASNQKVEDDKRTGILLEQYGTDTEDDDYDDDDDISDTQLMIKEMKAEAAYQEKKLIDQRRKDREIDKLGINSLGVEVKDSDEILKHIAEKELEVRLNHLQEKRRQRFNIYKLRLQEMDARVRAAELELSRREELHKLRVQHLKLLIMNQERFNQQERFDNEQYAQDENMQ
ncbi:hypothetical protein RUM43_000828 [Polyplax serrata]|uniref:Uncharacterized protein n=1 Tax=Polyplax serrata TaxID=468196 RepID=A0AAN8XR28_POLSC